MMTANDYRNILQQDPLNQEAFDGLLDEYRQTQSWHDACRLLESRASAVAGAGEPEEAVRLLLQAGELWQEQVNDQGRASDCYRQVLHLDPGNKTAIGALSNTYQEQNRWGEYADLLKGQMGIELDPAVKARLSFEVADVYLDHLHNYSMALTTLLEAEKEHPGERERVVKGLKALAEAWTGGDSALIDELNKAAGDLGEWELAADLLKRQARFADHPGIKGDFLQARAALALEKLHDQRLAVDWYVEAIGANPAKGDAILATIKELIQDGPEDLHSLAALREASLSLGKWQEAAVCLEKEIEANPDQETKARLYLELAALKETRLGDPILAGQLYQKAFQHHTSVGDQVVEGLQNLLKMPEHKENTALRKSLADVLEKLERVDDMAAILRSGAAGARSPEEAVELYCRAGEILAEKQPESPDKAREMFAAAIAVNPTGDNARALAGLEALARSQESDPGTLEVLRAYYTNREQWQDLLRIISIIDESEGDSGKKAALRFEMGHILEQRLGRKDSALSHYQAALKLDSTDFTYLEAARNLYRELNLWDTVLNLIQSQLELINTKQKALNRGSSAYRSLKERRADLTVEKAEVHLIHRDDPVAAFQVLSEILQSDFSNSRAQSLAKNLVSRENSRRMVLRSIMADSQTILAGDRESAREEGDGTPESIQSAVQALLLIGKVCELEPADPGAAVEAWQAALELQPNLEGTFYAVEDGLTRAGRWQELVDFYEKAANQEPEATGSRQRERRADLLCKAASIQVEQLKNMAGGFANLSTAYTINPANAAIRAQMVDRLRKAQAWSHLSQAYDLVLSLSPEAANRDFSIAILEQAAALKEDQLGDEHGAADLYGKLVELDPAHPAGVNFLRQYLRGQDQYKKLLQLLDDASAALATGGPDYLKEAAEISELQLGNIEGAMERWNKRLALMPRDDSTIKALRRLYTLVGRWSDMIDLIVAEAEGRSSISHRVEHYREAARLARDRVDDQKRAEQIYLKILSMLPSDVESLESLDSIYDRDSRWPELARILTMRALQAEQDGNLAVAIACRLRRARIMIEELFQVSDGVAELERVVDMAPENERGDGALIAAERLLDGTSAHEQMLALLEKRLARITSQEEEGDPESTPGQPEELAQLLEKAAVTAQNGLHDYNQAVTYWTRLLEVVPQMRAALEGLATCREKLGQWSDLVLLLRQLADLQEELDDKTGYLEQLAGVYEKRMLDLENSSLIWEELTDLVPDNYDYHLKLAASLRNLQAWERLAQAMNRHIGVETDPTRLAGLLVSLAQVYEEHLDDRKQAIGLLQQARKHAAGDNREVLSYLRRLLLGEEDFEGAVSTLEEEATMAPVGEAMVLLLEAADIEQNQLGQLDNAARRCEAMLDEDPTNKAVLRKLVELYGLLENNRALVGAIEKLLPLLDHAHRDEGEEKSALLIRLVSGEMDLERDQSAFDKGVRNLAQVKDLDTMFQLLGGIASRKTELWEQLLQGLVRTAESLADTIPAMDHTQEEKGAAVSRVVRLHKERASIYEDRLSDPKGAFGVWNQIFQLPIIDDRDRLGLVARLARLTEQAGTYRELGEAYSTLLKRFSGDGEVTPLTGDDTGDDLFDELLAGRSPGDLDIRYSLLEKRGALLEEHLGDFWAAFTDYSELSLLAKNEDEIKKYLDAAERAAGKGGIWEEYILLLDEHRRASSQDQEKIAFHLKAGQILYKELDEAEKAFDRYFNGFMLNMDDSAVLRQMEDLAEEQDAWHWLARVYVAGSREARNPESKVRFLRMLGDLQCEHLENPSGGCDTWALAYRLMPEDDQLLQDFIKAGERYERLDKVATVLEEMAAALQDSGDWSREKVQRERAIALFTGPMDQTGRAVPHWERFLVVDPKDQGTVENLTKHYGQAGEYRKLLVLHETVLDQLTEPRERAEKLCEIAQVQAEGLDERQEAVYTMRSAATIAPDHGPVIRKLAGFEGEMMGDWEEAARLYQQLATEVHVLGSEDWARDQLEVARIYSNRLSQPERAVTVLRHVLAQRPDSDDLSTEVEDLCSSAGLWTDYVEILEERLDTLKEDDFATRNNQLLKLANIEDTHLNRTDKATAHLEQILGTEPDHVGALEKLAQISARGEDYAHTAELLFRLGDALLGQVEAAAQAADPVEAPEEAETVDTPEEAEDQEVDQAEGDDGDGPVTTDEELVDAPAEPVVEAPVLTLGERAAQVFMDAGKLLLERGGDLNQAAQAYAKARKADLSNPAPLHALDQIFTQLERYDASFQIRLLIASMEEEADPARAATLYLNAVQAAEMLSTAPHVSQEEPALAAEEDDTDQVDEDLDETDSDYDSDYDADDEDYDVEDGEEGEEEDSLDLDHEEGDQDQDEEEEALEHTPPVTGYTGNARDDALIQAFSAALALDEGATLPGVMERRIQAMRDGDNHLAIKLIDLEIAGAAGARDRALEEPEVAPDTPVEAQVETGIVEDGEVTDDAPEEGDPTLPAGDEGAALEETSADETPVDGEEDSKTETETEQDAGVAAALEVLSALHLEKALILEQMGGDHLDLSFGEYQVVLELSPNSVTAVKGLGRVLRKQDRWDDLVTFLKAQLTLLEEDPATEPLRERDSLVELALITAKAGDRGQAIQYLHRAIDIDGNYAIALEALAGLETENGNLAEAAALYGRLIQILRTQVSEEKLVDWHRRRAGLLHQSGDLTQAMETWQSLLTVWPDDFEAMNSLAIVAAEAEEWDEVVGALELLIHGVEEEYGEWDEDDGDDEYYDYHDDDDDEEDEDGDYDGEYLDEDHEEEDEDDGYDDDQDYYDEDQWADGEGRGELYLRLAQALIKLDETEDAMAQLETARRMLPVTSDLLPVALLQLLDLKKSMGIADESLALAKELESIVTSDQARAEASAEVSRLQGFIVLRDGGEPAQAEAAFSRVLEHFPDDEGALAGLLEALRQSGKTGEILRVRKSHVDRHVDEGRTPDPRQALAVAYELEDADEETVEGLAGETDPLAYYRMARDHAGADRDVLFQASRQIALTEGARVLSDGDDQADDGDGDESAGLDLDSLNGAIHSLGRIATQDPEDQDVLELLLALLLARVDKVTGTEIDVTTGAMVSMAPAQIQLLLGDKEGLFNEHIEEATLALGRQVPVGDLLEPVGPVIAIFKALETGCPDLFPDGKLPLGSERIDLADQAESDELSGVPELFRELRSGLAALVTDGEGDGDSGGLAEQIGRTHLYLYPAQEAKAVPALLEGGQAAVLVSEGILELNQDRDRVAFMVGAALCGTLPGLHYGAVLDREEGQALMDCLRGETHCEMAGTWKTCLDGAGASKTRLAAAALLKEEAYQSLTYGHYLSQVEHACDRIGFLLSGKLDGAYRALSGEGEEHAGDTRGESRLGKLIQLLLTQGEDQAETTSASLAYNLAQGEWEGLTERLHTHAQAIEDETPAQAEKGDQGDKSSRGGGRGRRRKRRKKK